MTKLYKNYLGRNFKKARVPDKLEKKLRSSLMSKIRSSNTKFERAFIFELKKNVKKPFKICVKTIKGKPDIVFVNEKLCVFLDSDFWHGWQYPRWSHLLKDDFWRSKIENNRRRDIKVSRQLKKSGWKVVRIWEHEIKVSSQRSLIKIKNILNKEKTA